MTDKTIFRIGSRRSTLAIIQSEQVKTSIEHAHPDLQVEIVPMSTKGDWKPTQGEVKLDPNAGGKALWVEDIEKALLAGDIDCAVHSMKDVPSVLPDTLQVAHTMEREDPRDAFISVKYATIQDLPKGAVIGTSSARRKAVLKYMRPDLEIVTFRGNVGTRIQKLEDGQVDAIILAVAGLKRMAREDVISQYLSFEEMLPAAGQGIIGIESRKDDLATKHILDQIHCVDTGYRARAEREVLRVLDGSCATPIGVFAQINNDDMQLRAFVACPEGHALYQEQITGPVESNQDCYDLGHQLGVRLKSLVPEELLSKVG